MMRLVLLISLVFAGSAGSATAQAAEDVVWVQIEARPSLEAAIERAQEYATTLPDVNGFALPGGWYAVALGPYTRDDAEAVIESYRNQRLIPFDSYIAFSLTYGPQYWPPGGDLPGSGEQAALVVDPAPGAATPAEPEPPAPVELGAVDAETLAEARRGETQLTAEERQGLQTALQWAGFYNAAIDGAFGRGTRNSMAAWQSANGFEPTGVLTTLQRAALMRQYNAVLEGLDMQMVRDLDAGIEIRMPAARVSFARYEAPFAHYDGKDGRQERVLLISQQGDAGTLKSLYDVMQTLEVVPLQGPRRLSGNSFSIEGRNTTFVSTTEVSLAGDEIKGFTLVWPTGDETRRLRVLQEMRDSLVRRTGTLDPAAGVPAAQRIDLLAGLEIRKPRVSRSGFFVDDAGTVVTTLDAVQSCTRITLDSRHDATLAEMDAARGIAVLKPEQRLAPPTVARFSPVPPRLQSEVAVAGYSFEGQLGAASMTFGTLSDVRDLTGDSGRNRLSLNSLPGDAGGPVLDASGNVFGMLLPQPDGNRQLPEEVRFALTSAEIIDVLKRAGLGGGTEPETGVLDPIDIANRGVGMTVLVSCWN